MKTLRMLILSLAIWVLILSGNTSLTLGQTAAQPRGDVELAQKLVGTWVCASQSPPPQPVSGYWEIEATGVKVRGKLWHGNYGEHQELYDYTTKKFRDAGPDESVGIFEAEVRNGRLMGTIYSPHEAVIERKPINWEFNLSPDGRSLTLSRERSWIYGPLHKK